MDDDHEGNGPGGWAWYQLGRMSVRHDDRMAGNRDLVWSILQPQQPYDPEVELQKANQNILAWMEHCEALKRDLGQKNDTIKQHRAEIAALQERLDLAMKCYDGVSSDSNERLLKIEALEALVEKLRKGEA